VEEDIYDPDDAEGWEEISAQSAQSASDGGGEPEQPVAAADKHQQPEPEPVAADKHQHQHQHQQDTLRELEGGGATDSDGKEVMHHPDVSIIPSPWHWHVMT
jgi:hypothetical protein